MDCIDLTIDDSESERPQSFPKSSSRSPINIDSETETEDDSDVEFVSYGPGSGIRTPSTTRKNLLLEANLDNRKKRPRSRSGTRSASPLHGVTSSMSLVCLDSPPRTLTKPIRKFTTNATGDNNRFSTPCKAGPSRIGSSSMDMDTVKGDDADRDLAVVPTPGRLVNKKKVSFFCIGGTS
ncbi:hypothetical protein BT96DRAFT_103741 [Gymnopus androsaceus JB14]|uniref:Uncharacterized protein n=1 Tax=Gymnopus androsaceus JB14 TaxID=1447944 RepID=A0A6A4IA17_9AGAR|nr:hypothetical protein BT96DRAFT_103741 [Gymnopus androsaceus JB14]